MLDQAQAIWDERRAGAPAEQVAADAAEDVRTYIAEWLGQVVRRLEPEALVGLVEMFKEIDEEGRLRRLLGMCRTTIRATAQPRARLSFDGLKRLAHDKNQQLRA